MNRSKRHDDSGTILPMVLLVSVIMFGIVMALASYMTTELHYGRVVEARANRLAAADGGLRYGFETLSRGSFASCLTALGTSGGASEIFPPNINNASIKVTCKKLSNGISDVEGWGVILTGEGFPATDSLLITQGGGTKTFGGPMYVADPRRIDTSGGGVEIKFGDLWFTDTCPSTVPLTGISYTPVNSGYGPICVPQPRTSFFPDLIAGTLPANTPPTPTPPPAPGGCKVFFPGVYTAATFAQPGWQLSDFNYFASGDYLFNSVPINLVGSGVEQSMLAGFPSGNGDVPNVDIPECAFAQAQDVQNQLIDGLGNPYVGDGRGGATFYMAGSSYFNVDNKGELEIFRREQTLTQNAKSVKQFVSVFAVPGNAPGGSGYIIDTKSGNTNDISISGLVWAPRNAIRLGNITNAANGQMVGGVVLGKLNTQASASASAFSVGISAGPNKSRILLTSTATLNGDVTSMRAVVEYRPDINGSSLAVNSWRVCDNTACN